MSHTYLSVCVCAHLFVYLWVTIQLSSIHPMSNYRFTFVPAVEISCHCLGHALEPNFLA